jgi:hypothetical protein
MRTSAQSKIVDERKIRLADPQTQETKAKRPLPLCRVLILFAFLDPKNKRKTSIINALQRKKPPRRPEKSLQKHAAFARFRVLSARKHRFSSKNKVLFKSPSYR